MAWDRFGHDVACQNHGTSGCHELLLDELTRPLAVPTTTEDAEEGQSLARGAAGIALWHIERAHHNDTGSQERVHAWVQAALAEPVSNAEAARLFAGLPAITFLLHTAEPVIPDYQRVIKQFDAHLVRLVHRRVEAATARIDRGELPAFAEYDLLHGLTGIGQLLLGFLPGNDALARVLQYLVRLTQPLRVDGESVPGWWAGHDPDPLLPTPGGHTNLGLAHGIAVISGVKPFEQTRTAGSSWARKARLNAAPVSWCCLSSAMRRARGLPDDVASTTANS